MAAASAQGRLGSLILTNTNCAHPVALLFAGSTSDTIGNPISAVLSALAHAGDSASFVGQSCTAPNSPQSGAKSLVCSTAGRLDWCTLAVYDNRPVHSAVHDPVRVSKDRKSARLRRCAVVLSHGQVLLKALPLRGASECEDYYNQYD